MATRLNRNPAASVLVYPQTLAAQPGRTRDFLAFPVDAEGNSAYVKEVTIGGKTRKRVIKWRVSDPSILRMSPLTGSNGAGVRVEMLAPGTAQVTCSFDGVEGSATVSVV